MVEPELKKNENFMFFTLKVIKEIKYVEQNVEQSPQPNLDLDISSKLKKNLGRLVRTIANVYNPHQFPTVRVLASMKN